MLLQNLVTRFYPDLRPQEARKYGLLSLIFFLIIGAYWLLRLLKNTIFTKIAFPETLGWLPKQGVLYLPTAKIISPIIMFLFIFIYSYLVDKVKKHQLFYILCSIYASLFAVIGVIVLLYEWYGPAFVGKLPLAVTGWASYFIVESFGSFIVALFWSFTNSISDPNSAKKGFPFIIFVSHLGAILFSSTLLLGETIGALWPILITLSMVVASIIPIVFYFMKTTPSEYLIGYKAAQRTKESKDGILKSIFAGLILFFTRPYLIGIFVVTTFHQAVSQIVDYQMVYLTNETTEWEGTYAFAKFQAIYGMSINILSLFIALLGTRYLFQKYGMRLSIMIYPISYGLLLFAMFGYITFGSPTPTHLLWTTFAILIIVKGIGYAVNNPTKEIMYIPTSKDAKFKTKSFIETVGSRGAKAGGATISNLFKGSISHLMIFGTLYGLGFILIWGVFSFFVGKKYTSLIGENEIIK